MWLPSSSLGAFPVLQVLLPWYDISDLNNSYLLIWYQFHSRSIWTQNQKIREWCICSGINVFLNISQVERVNVLFFALRWKHNTRDTESQLSKADAEITKSLLKWVLKKMAILSGMAPTWLHQYLFFWGTCVYVVGCKWNPGQSWPGIKESFRALQNH